MATGTPFHSRTSQLCESRAWRQWSGYFAAGSYGDYIQPEYAAIRHSAALIDVSPLYKVEVRGRDAAAFVDRVVTQHVARTEPDQVSYTCWCDPDGAVRQDGTVFRLAEDRFLINAAEPALSWLRRNAVGFHVEIEDRSRDLAALSLQGPLSRAVLLEAGVSDVEELPFFRLARGPIGGVEVMVSRTGYTGDLGYEIWIPASEALSVWDRLMAVGADYHVTPCGLVAMDIARVEAGFVLINVDYTSAELALHPDDRVSPFEIGLGWTVKLQKPSFVGREALVAEKNRGSRRRLVGLEIDWSPLEELYLEAGLMPDLPQVPCREPVPIYAADEDGEQIGRATTRVWSTLLKKYLALATVDSLHAATGGEVAMEVTVHYRRRRAPARVVKPSFFRPPRGRA